MNITDHHAHPAIGASFLKAFLRSPAHAYAAFLDPARTQPSGQAFAFGSAWHCALFEPAEFPARYALDHAASKATTKAKTLAALLADPTNGPHRIAAIAEKKTTKAGAALYAEAIDADMIPMPPDEADWIRAEYTRLRGKLVITATDRAAIVRMIAVAHAHPTIDRALSHPLAATEQSVIVDDRKCRPDLMIPPCAEYPHGLCVDGKTTQDASALGFARDVRRYGYGLQAAHYADVLREHWGTTERPAMQWWAQEKTSPRAIAVHAPSPETLIHWSGVIADTLPRVRECIAADRWPGYPEDVTEIDAIPWDVVDADEIITGDDADT